MKLIFHVIVQENMFVNKKILLCSELDTFLMLVRLVPCLHRSLHALFFVEYQLGTRLTGISQAPLYYNCIITVLLNIRMCNMLYAQLGPIEEIINILFY